MTYIIQDPTFSQPNNIFRFVRLQGASDYTRTTYDLATKFESRRKAFLTVETLFPNIDSDTLEDSVFHIKDVSTPKKQVKQKQAKPPSDFYLYVDGKYYTLVEGKFVERQGVKLATVTLRSMVRITVLEGNMLLSGHTSKNKNNPILQRQVKVLDCNDNPINDFNCGYSHIVNDKVFASLHDRRYLEVILPDENIDKKKLLDHTFEAFSEFQGIKVGESDWYTSKIAIVSPWFIYCVDNILYFTHKDIFDPIAELLGN